MGLKTVVVGLGGNALAPRSGPQSADSQRQRIRETGNVLGRAADRTRLVVTHGNGPQVGMLAARETSLAPEERSPLDVVTAQTEAMIGCLLQRELEICAASRLRRLLTEVLVDPADPAFANPTKPIGAYVDETRARGLHDALGWTFRPSGSNWRRVVPSPEPIDVLELPVIRRLVTSGVVVICAGGGGIRRPGRGVGHDRRSRSSGGQGPCHLAAGDAARRRCAASADRCRRGLRRLRDT